MDLYILNGLSGLSGIINTFQSCIWNVQYYGQNEFQLVVNASQENVDNLKPGTMLVRDVDIDGNTFKNIMVVQNYKLDLDTEKGWLLTLSGTGLKSYILKRRIVWSQTNLTGNAETAIRSVITDNVISPSDTDRAIGDVVLADAKGFTEEIELQLFGENIADWLEEICTTYGYGWDMYIANGKYVFDLYKGTDRTYDQDEVAPVVFSPEYDNLLSSSYTYNMADYRNAALIGGEGSGTSQRTTSIGSSSGLDRYEMYVDGSSVSSNGEIITVDQYLAMLQEYGQTQLINTAYTENFSGNIDTNGLYVINEDFFLGDLVQIENEKGIQATPRIIEVIYAEDESGSSCVPTFSKWEVE